MSTDMSQVGVAHFNIFLVILPFQVPFILINIKTRLVHISTQIIKNIIIRRKESDNYLATVSRHRWSS
jgi:hypothetical protein